MRPGRIARDPYHREACNTEPAETPGAIVEPEASQAAVAH